MSAKALFRQTFLILSMVFVAPVFAGPDDHDHDKEPFNPGEMILDHIGDEHGWHLWGHTTLPLPVIIYENGSLTTFMSSKFNHGEDTYKGYALEGHSVVAVNELGLKDENRKFYDLITKNVVSLWISIAILLFVFLGVARAYKKREGKAPTGLQNFLEPLILFVRDDVAKSAIGEKKYRKFMPFLLTVFFFIFLNNLLGLIPFFPGGANLTGNIAVALVLALLTFIITTVHGNGHYWRHILAMPGVPAWVLIILTPVELVGVLLKPFVLMIRLFANVTAGHIIVLSFFALIFVFGETSTGAGYGVAIGALAFTVFMTLLELLVAFIQAYVFTFLSAMYFGSAVEEAHDHH